MQALPTSPQHAQPAPAPAPAVLPGASERGQNLVSVAVRAITSHMREHALAPGDRLPSEAALCHDLAVSRTVVREALCCLSALRLVDLSPGKRAVVARLDHDPMAQMIGHGIQTDQISILHVYDVRRAIETRTATLAALRRTDAEAQQILAHALALRTHSDQPALAMEHDLALHLAIARASRNPVFALIVGSFAEVTRQTWPIGWRSRPSDAGRDAMVALHIEMAQAIVRGDPQAASDLMARHFDDSARALAAAGIG